MFTDTELPELFSIDEFLEPESIDREYKAFTFNLTGLNIDLEFAHSLCESNKFIFNEQTISNLEEYLNYFPPKYLSGFFNSQISGKLLIGPDDWGVVRGIPYQGELPIDELTSKFYENLKKKVYNENFSCNLEDFIKIKFIKINYFKDNIQLYVDKQNSIYTKYLEDKKVYDNVIALQREEYNEWKVRYLFIQQKLSSLLNNCESRILIINFIKNILPDSSVIKLLESEEKIIILTPEEITPIVKDNTNPYYWASEWKEYMCIYLQKQRPRFTKILFTEFNTPFNLINSVSNMVHFWMANNPDMNLYVVQIDFNYDNEIMNKLGKWYYVNNMGKLVSCIRIIKGDGEPANYPE
jgi:hypothetical protein